MLLGGIVGVGTVLYALAIGPLVQFFLPLVAVRLPPTRQILNAPERTENLTTSQGTGGVAEGMPR